MEHKFSMKPKEAEIFKARWTGSLDFYGTQGSQDFGFKMNVITKVAT